ncbi:hypothetical protein G6011_02719 [Alternaria panax]|uniref:Uncharacterized protein n=1 Tax=Alternaria panax TaxID=48097 RepID=A0AAD4I563_9PLEO|nr:hypothetical protein G6011_02719 [Alternaria panax]
MPPKTIFGGGAKFHSFGIERPYDTLPAERSTSGAGAKMSLSSTGSGDLAFATTKQVPTLKESDLSRRVEQVSNNMSGRGETASNQSEQVLRERCDALQQQLNEEYDRAGSLEQQYDKLKDENARFKNEFEKLKREREDTEYALKTSEDTLAEEQSTIKALEKRNIKLEEVLARKEAALEDRDKQNAILTADCQHLSSEYELKVGEIDDLRAKFLNKKLQFDDLQDQWQTDQERIAELEAAIKEHEDSNLVAELENDIAGLHAIQEQDSRTIIVKDERISHLEGLLQKEQQRNLHNADETARAAAASPVDDQRHIGSMGGTLEDEFSSLMLDENDFIECEPSEYELELQTLSPVHVVASVTPVAAHLPVSRIDISQAASVTPRNPVPAPPSSIVVNKAASTEPAAVKMPAHIIAVRDAASVEPRDPTPAPPSTINVSEAASTAPEAARVPVQTTGFYKTLSTEPVEPARVRLSFRGVDDIASFAPDQPTGAPLDYSLQKAASTEPIEPARAPLSVRDVHHIASYAPKQPAGALLRMHEQKSVSTEPIEPARDSLSFDHVYDIASFAPDRPAPVVSTIVRHEIANFAPKEPSLPMLAVDVTEVASTRPVARQITSAELSTQTDAPTTTDLSVQTDAPALTSQLLTHTVLATTPIEPSTYTAIVKPSNHIGPIMVTREIKPVEQAPPKPEPERPTPTTEAQAHINKDTAEEHAMANTPSVTATRSKKAIFTGWIPMLLAVLLAVWSLVLQAELATWKNANGVGFGGGYGNVASRSGAYGNGRHLFGVIPIGMNMGNSWVSEQIARRMSMAISLIEDWAGIVNEPMY